MGGWATEIGKCEKMRMRRADEFHRRSKGDVDCFGSFLAGIVVSSHLVHPPERRSNKLAVRREACSMAGLNSHLSGTKPKPERAKPKRTKATNQLTGIGRHWCQNKGHVKRAD